MSVSVVAPRSLPLNPGAESFVSSRSGSEASSPPRCSSPEAPERGPVEVMDGERLAPVQGGPPGHAREGAVPLGPADGSTPASTIPGPAPRLGLSRRSSSGSLSNRGRSASPPPLPLPHPGLLPTYGWGTAVAMPVPVYHVYPPPPGSAELERSASPPAVFPQGGSPPLPTGFISVPLQPVRAPPSDPSSPTARPMYGASPPHPHHHMPYGNSPPHPHVYGSSPPGMPGSPPGMLYMPPGPGPFVPHPHPGGSGPETYGMHAAYSMHAQQQQQQQADFVQHMAGMSLSQQQPAGLAQQQQQQQQGVRPGSSNGAAGAGAGRSEGRASARIARSHRAGGAYNPAEFAFDLEEAQSGRPDARCTVMIRNIPNKYNQAQMLSILEKSGFSGSFDFFYLPIDFRNRCNLGYCFVNFLDAQDAGRLYRKYHNQRWEEFNSKKVCEVTYARVQGRDALVQHFRASKFPSDDATELMPLVYNTDSGRAADPLPIHAYLAEVEGVASEQGASAAANGGSEAEEEEGG